MPIEQIWADHLCHNWTILVDLGLRASWLACCPKLWSQSEGEHH